MTTEKAAEGHSVRVTDPDLMANHSDAVCKRSVERLYYPEEPSFLRHFVKKPQRKSPLTNRCYWLRLKAVDATVGQFLTRHTFSKKKAVVHLGCGNDVLPWRCNYRYPDACKDAVFIDMDNVDSLREKRAVILNTPHLRELLGFDHVVAQNEPVVNPIVLQSPRYCQVACDSGGIENLQKALSSIFPQTSGNPDLLILTESSFERNRPTPSESLLSWAASLAKVEICFLGPIMPHGPRNLYTDAMMNGSRTSSSSSSSDGDAGIYPTMGAHKDRLQATGWGHVQVRDLWQVWEGDELVTKEDRLSLNHVEPFDEWEDFILWCRHHVLIRASCGAGQTTTTTTTTMTTTTTSSSLETLLPEDSLQVRLHWQRHLKPVKRRFGAMTAYRAPNGQLHAAHLFGSDINNQLETYELYTVGSHSTSSTPMKLPTEGPPARACFTLTDLGDYGHLLVGGRKSSGQPCADCWVLKKGPSPRWERAWNLPAPIFRHSVVRVKGTSFALLLGGKTSTTEVSSEAFLFHPERGWLVCRSGANLNCRPSFGASLVSLAASTSEVDVFEGLSFGGLYVDGTFKDVVGRWSLRVPQGEEPTIQYDSLSDISEQPGLRRLCVFGAQAVEKDGSVLICGGVGSLICSQGQALTCLCPGRLHGQYRVIELTCDIDGDAGHLPLLVGHSALVEEKSITLFGGGASCLPNNRIWQNESITILFEHLVLAPPEPPQSDEHVPLFEYRQSPKISAQSNNTRLLPGMSTDATATMVQIPRLRLKTGDEFQTLLRGGKPVIIQGLDVGQCTDRWAPSYMKQKVGRDQKVVAHECRGTTKMDFNAKNFEYVTDTFANIMAKVEAGGQIYLRSLSNDNPSEMPANIEEDFPWLAQDFILPDEVGFVRENLFSSILRVSGRVSMWLHYDVMANVYTQIRGSKRMILFPPSDVSHLGFAPGASSSSLDVFSALETPILSQTRPHEAHLKPGDMLLIPSMWHHTATPTSDMSVAVNVFFRDLERGYSTGRDVYGNRDLAAYEKARQDASKILKSFDKMPLEIRRFYLTRIADELKDMAEEC